LGGSQESLAAAAEAAGLSGVPFGGPGAVNTYGLSRQDTIFGSVTHSMVGRCNIKPVLNKSA
jgi:hypothetical protein